MCRLRKEIFYHSQKLVWKGQNLCKLLNVFINHWFGLNRLKELNDEKSARITELRRQIYEETKKEEAELWVATVFSISESILNLIICPMLIKLQGHFTQTRKKFRYLYLLLILWTYMNRFHHVRFADFTIYLPIKSLIAAVYKECSFIPIFFYSDTWFQGLPQY